MGDRALITTYENIHNGNSLCIYTHWNGSLDNVMKLLASAKKFQIIAVEDNRELNEFNTVLHTCFRLGFHVSVVRLKDKWLSSIGDNGIYVVKNFEIVAHYENVNGREE